MRPYDIVFVGHMALDEVHNFGGDVSIGVGSAVLCGALAAAKVGSKVAVVTRMAPQDEHLLDGLRMAGVDRYVIPAAATTYMQVFHTSRDVDQRQIVQLSSAGFFHPADIPSLTTRIYHLAGISDQEFGLSFLDSLKADGVRLSADMQSFIRQVDQQNGEVLFRDFAQKQDIVQRLDYVKLDIVEAEILTGKRDLKQAAHQIAAWGGGEVIITCSEGVLALVDEQYFFSSFTNRSVVGRTGRGDTTFGAYLAWRADHSVQAALDFSAALASIKMESPGPFNGSKEDVLRRLNL